MLQQRGAPPPDWLKAPGASPAPTITRLALEESDELCQETLHWFVELYGREAGNLALKMNASGGIYLGGGIAPGILPALQDGRFMDAFLDKGRMRPLLEATPVRVVCSDVVAPKGLVRYALRTRRGEFELERAAGRLGHRASTIAAGLEHLAASGTLAIIERGEKTWRLEAGTGNKIGDQGDTTRARLDEYLDETLAYRRGFRQMPAGALARRTGLTA